MKRIFLIFVMLISMPSFCQQASVSENAETALREPVQFDHLPVLLIKIKPSAMFELNNTFQYGIEIAPPVGKFSFSFDYGKGKGSLNPYKYIRTNQKNNKNTELRGEIRMYFSDWFPFYALDKKPFGRYYAIEYFNTKYNREYDIASGVGGKYLPNYAIFESKKMTETNQGVNLKIGKHIHINKHLFVDIFAGGGLGYFKSNYDEEPIAEIVTVPLHTSFLSNKNTFKTPGTKGLFFSKTLGFRLAFVL